MRGIIGPPKLENHCYNMQGAGLLRRCWSESCYDLNWFTKKYQVRELRRSVGWIGRCRFLEKAIKNVKMAYRNCTTSFTIYWNITPRTHQGTNGNYNIMVKTRSFGNPYDLRIWPTLSHWFFGNVAGDLSVIWYSAFAGASLNSAVPRSPL